jgi:hypothetical protein
MKFKKNTIHKKAKKVKVEDNEKPYDNIECFKLDDEGRSVFLKVVILCAYLLLSAVIAVIIDPFLHEFGHILFSGLDGYLMFDFSGITNVYICAHPNHIYFWTYAGGVTMEFLFSMACATFSIFKRSVLFSVLSVVSFLFPTIYCITYLCGYVPAGCDFVWFGFVQWVAFWIMFSISLILVVAMLVVNFTRATKSAKQDRVVCVF